MQVIPNFDKSLEFLQNEMNCTTQYINKHKDMQIAILRIYFLIVGALFTYATVIVKLGDKLATTDNGKNGINQYTEIYGYLGIGLTIFTFSVGYAVLSYTSHSIGRLIMANKQIALCRTIILKKLKGNLDEFRSYLPSNLESVRDQSKDRTSHYIFSLFNSALLLFIILFTQSLNLDFNTKFTIFISAFAIFFLLYPYHLAYLLSGFEVPRRAKSAAEEVDLWNNFKKIKINYKIEKMKRYDYMIRTLFFILILSIVLFNVRDYASVKYFFESFYFSFLIKGNFLVTSCIILLFAILVARLRVAYNRYNHIIKNLFEKVEIQESQSKTETDKYL